MGEGGTTVREEEFSKGEERKKGGLLLKNCGEVAGRSLLLEMPEVASISISVNPYKMFWILQSK